jgi:hypothetical protein
LRQVQVSLKMGEGFFVAGTKDKIRPSGFVYPVRHTR